MSLIHPSWIPLQAGPVRAFLDTATMSLRAVALRSGDQEVEVVRSIYAAVRDQNWGTILPDIQDFQLVESEGGFRTSFTAVCRLGPINFTWQGQIEGSADGSIQYGFEGEAHSDFLRNRIGFCVLHPIKECAGEPCEIRHDDGSLTTGVFPRLVSPHQPFFGIRSISHAPFPHQKVQMEFEGDVFEMEDQRNWTDASYKTYCTPLEIPYPVQVAAGTHIRQKVTVQVVNEAPTADVSPRNAQDVSLPIQSTKVPQIGVGMASHGLDLSPTEVNLLRDLNLNHLRVDLATNSPGWRDRLVRASRESVQIGSDLEVAVLHLDSFLEEIDEVAAIIQREGASVKTWLFYPEPNSFIDFGRIKSLIGRATPAARIIGGTNAYFTDLNRQRPNLQGVDGVCFSINPQVHAFDDVSLMETVEALPAIVASTNAIYPELPLTVSPITLRPRFNAVATSEELVAPGALPPTVDARQASDFAAAWTLATLVALTTAGVDGVTLFETTGWRGLMDSEQAGANHLVRPGEVFPVYQVLKDFAQFSGGTIQHSVLETQDEVSCICLAKESATTLLVANKAATEQSVMLSPLTSTGLWFMDGEPITSPLELRPYQYIRLDWQDQHLSKEG